LTPTPTSTPTPTPTLAATKIGQDIDGAAWENCGECVSINSSGNIVAVGCAAAASYRGKAKVYQLINGNWTNLGADIAGETAGERCGKCVVLNSTGDTIAVSSPTYSSATYSQAGKVRVLKLINGTWTQLGQTFYGEYADAYLGNKEKSISLNSTGNILAIGDENNSLSGNGARSGRVRIYQLINQTWTQIGKDINGSNSYYLGGAVSLNDAGDIISVGAYNATLGGVNNIGLTKVYKLINGSWTKIGLTIAGDVAGDFSGFCVSTNNMGDIIAIGARMAASSMSAQGLVRVYKLINASWTKVGQDIYGEARFDESGASLSINDAGNIIAIGAHQNDGNGNLSGHVRIYQLINNIWVKIVPDIDGENADNLSGISVSLNAAGNIVAIGAPVNDGGGTYSGHVRVYSIP